MGEWWTYGLEDFLLFSPRVHWRLVEAYNTELWPLHVAALAVGVVVLALAARAPRGGGRIAALLLAGAWAFVGWAFLLERHATINWAAPHAAAAFLMQAALLAAAGGLGRGLGLELARGGAARWLGVAVLAFAVVVQPMSAPLLGRSWAAAEVFAVMPDPTAIGTLGLLAAARGRWVAALAVIPALWCLVAGATLWTMEEPAAWLPPAAAALALAAMATAGIVGRRA